MRLFSINSCKHADAPKKEMYVLAEDSRNRVNDVEKAEETSPLTNSQNETVADLSNNA